MLKFNRREFMQASAGSLVLDAARLSASSACTTKGDEAATAFARTNAEGRSTLLTTPEGACQLRSIITGQLLGARTGEQLHHGLQIQLPAKHRVEILEIRKQAP